MAVCHVGGRACRCGTRCFCPKGVSHRCTYRHCYRRPTANLSCSHPELCRRPKLRSSAIVGEVIQVCPTEAAHRLVCKEAADLRLHLHFADDAADLFLAWGCLRCVIKHDVIEATWADPSARQRAVWLE